MLSLYNRYLCSERQPVAHVAILQNPALLTQDALSSLLEGADAQNKGTASLQQAIVARSQGGPAAQLNMPDIQKAVQEAVQTALVQQVPQQLLAALQSQPLPRLANGHAGAPEALQEELASIQEQLGELRSQGQINESHILSMQQQQGPVYEQLAQLPDDISTLIVRNLSSLMQSFLMNLLCGLASMRIPLHGCADVFMRRTCQSTAGSS